MIIQLHFTWYFKENLKYSYFKKSLVMHPAFYIVSRCICKLITNNHSGKIIKNRRTSFGLLNQDKVNSYSCVEKTQSKFPSIH